MTKIECQQCRKIFSVKPSHRLKRTHCSIKCRNEHYKILLRGEKAPNWKGGRKTTIAGYILLYQPKNPMANCDGYVYEHRLIMSQTVGRALLTDEQVHHIDGNKANNKPENLEIISDSWHRIKHKKTKERRQLPQEQNKMILCACGCGKLRYKFDGEGRFRIFISGHNMKNTRGTHYENRAMVG